MKEVLVCTAELINSENIVPSTGSQPPEVMNYMIPFM